MTPSRGSCAQVFNVSSVSSCTANLKAHFRVWERVPTLLGLFARSSTTLTHIVSHIVNVASLRWSCWTCQRGVSRRFVSCLSDGQVFKPSGETCRAGSCFLFFFFLVFCGCCMRQTSCAFSHPRSDKTTRITSQPLICRPINAPFSAQ